MSTPRVPRKSYVSQSKTNLVGPLSDEELSISILQKCGVGDEVLTRLVKGAAKNIEEAFEATMKLPIYSGGKIVDYDEQVDYGMRLRASDMALKLANAYPQKNSKPVGPAITINLPEYYRPPKEPINVNDPANA